MKRAYLLTSVLMIGILSESVVLADGGMFVRIGETADLAQTRQEVVMAFHRDAADTADQATYVLRSRYSGNPESLAWVIPVPATPTNVTAHQDGTLFDNLEQETEPVFTIIFPSSGIGCVCAPALTGQGGQGGLVTVEASGQAGIFNWSALTSTGGTALLTWLNNNGFALPTGATEILNGYILLDMHFLAVTVNKPSAIQQDANGGIEIPPIQFTCQTTQRFYPIAISQISAASQTEIIIYILANHRAAAANVQNGVIDPNAVIYDANSSSLTNYEALFTQKIADLGATGLITEYADQYSIDNTTWPDAPSGANNLSFLTRMRTVLASANMANLDYQFQDAANDETVSRYFSVSASTGTEAASLAGQSLVAFLLFGFLRAATKRRNR
ncbi:MAG: DUF2330 domain-containing protein [Planctomycetota bacterium]|jgi:hypothetical protein